LLLRKYHQKVPNFETINDTTYNKTCVDYVVQSKPTPNATAITTTTIAAVEQEDIDKQQKAQELW
jgi:hypothetical protein